jgi:hypothetical protein
MPQTSYAILEHPQHYARRASWSGSDGVQYCGICMRGVIQPELGHSCSNCGSQVRQVFEVIRGGSPRNYRAEKRALMTDRSTAAESFLKVQTM